MPWKVQAMPESRLEFVRLMASGAVSMQEACRRFGISRTCGYKWRDRYAAEGESGLCDRSRRPHSSPALTQKAVEALILDTREAHSAWGGRKLRRFLLNEGHREIPAASTITEILRRHGKLDPEEALKHQPCQRFERATPNELWQMDFKGHVACPQGRCHPLGVLDDCTRYSVALEACGDESGDTVQQCLTTAFRHHGLPWRMLTDNGGPWGNNQSHAYTPLSVWLLRLGVMLSHGRPSHPQTQGKLERFNRTLKTELLGDGVPWSLEECQRRFDAWRDLYNWTRPHEALGLDVPGARYRASERPFPDKLPPIEYDDTDIVRKVQQMGRVHYGGKTFRIPKAFAGHPVALRPRADKDGLLDVFFCRQCVAAIDLAKPRAKGTPAVTNTTCEPRTV